MVFQREEGFLDELAENLATELFDEASVDHGEYISGTELLDIKLPAECKTRYYGQQAADRENLEKIREYMEPIGYRVNFSKTKSALLGTTSDATVYIVDLSLFQLLAQGKAMGKIPGKHDYEMFVVGDSKMKSELKGAIDEVMSG